MKKAIFAVAFLAIVIVVIITLQNPNKLSKELYVEACGYLQNLKSSASFTEAFALCNKANSNIEQIVSKYSSSDMAIALLSGQIKVLDLTIDQLREKTLLFRQLSEAEQDPLSCSLALVLHKRMFEALTEIAGKYIAVGRNETAKQILDKAIESKQFNENMEAQIDIATQYYEANYKDVAYLLLNKLRNQIILSNQPNADQLRTKVALAYAKLGQIDFSLEMVGAHKDQKAGAQAFASAVDALMLSEKDNDKVIICGMELANRLVAPNDKALVLGTLINFLKKFSGKTSNEVLLQILDVTKTLIEHESDYYVTKCKLALTEYLVTMGLFDEALNLATSMQNSSARVYAFLPLLNAFSAAGKKGEIESTLALAQASFDSFFADLNKIEQDYEKFESFYTFVCSFNGFFKKSRASQHLETLLQFASEIEFMSFRMLALTKVGVLFFLSGEKERSKVIFNQAKSLLDSDQTGEAYEMSHDLSKIALESPNLELFSCVLSVFESLPECHLKSRDLADLSLKLANFEQKAAAKQLLYKSA